MHSFLKLSYAHDSEREQREKLLLQIKWPEAQRESRVVKKFLCVSASKIDLSVLLRRSFRLCWLQVATKAGEKRH